MSARNAITGHFDAHGLQLRCDDLRRARLAVAEFGMLVEVAPPFDDLGHRGRDGAIDGVRGARSPGSAGEGHQAGGGSESGIVRHGAQDPKWQRRR
jgi:hypothetical protein